MARATIVLCGVLVVARLAAAAEFVFFTPEYSYAGISVMAKRVTFDRDLMKFRLVVMNGTSKLVHLEKGAFQVRLDRGVVVQCTARGGHDLYPGQAHPLDLNFRVGDLPQAVALVMSGVLVDGNPYPLPDYVVRRTP